MKRLLLTIAFISLFFNQSIFAQNNCLNFDGTDDFVNIGNVDATNGATKLTVEMWANISTWKNQGVLFSRRSAHTNKLSLMEDFTTGAFIVLIANSNSVDVTFTSGAITLDQWFHIAFVYDGDGATNADKLKIYINGSLVGGVSYSGTLPATLGNDSPFMLGREALDADYTSFSGKIDEVRVWSTARTITEINDKLNTSLTGNEAGLLLYYNFNQGVAGGDNTGLTTLNDNTLAGTYDGTLTNFALTGSTSNWIEDNNPTFLVGDGSLGDPYQITTLENLLWISQNSTEWDKYYIQTADIDASTTSTWNSGAGWTPIGNSTTNFTGSYDGQGHTINGLYINNSTSFTGPFGYSSGTISNLGVINVNITTGSSDVGGLAGYAKTVSNCYSTGSVTGTQYVGGLIGLHSGGTLSNSYSSCTVTATSQGGGLVGRNYSSPIQNCYSLGNVSYASFDRTNGGFVGWNNASISYCYSTGSVSGETTEGFVSSDNSGSSYTSNFFDETTSGQTSGTGATGKTTLEMKTQSIFTDAGWDFLGEIGNGANDYWNTSGGRNDGYPFLTWQILPTPSGSGTSGDPYQIATLENLYWITASDVDVPTPNQANRWAANYIQTVNIDASSTSTWDSGLGWSPIGNLSVQFTGNYNGNSKTISGLYINRVANGQGFFGSTNGGSISNLGLMSININAGGAMWWVD